MKVYELLSCICLKANSMCFVSFYSGAIRENVFLLALGPRAQMGAGVPGRCGASAAGPAEEASLHP